jgi:uncharacterized protein
VVSVFSVVNRDVTNNDRLTLEWLPGRYAVCRLAPHASLPAWATDARATFSHSQECENVATSANMKAAEARPALLSITRTERELSIVIHESRLPPDLEPTIPTQRGFAALRIAGTLDFSLLGIIAKLTSALAAANIPVFVLSTYDTDIILLPERDARRAEAALRPIADIEAQQQHL